MKADEFNSILEDLKKRKIPAIVKKVVSILLDKKAEEVIVLKLKGTNNITDFMVICHGNSTRQNNALASEIEKKLRKEHKAKAFGIEGAREAEWILLDYIDFIVHVFSKSTRNKYTIEKLWMDAKRYNFYLD
jgi:ribosome-associated protein